MKTSAVCWESAGVDGISIEEYGKNLAGNIKQLAEKIRRGTYRPQPVRRIYIPKANGKLRPLGIPAVEDKIVQLCMTRILTAVYEKDFMDFSYGFRPGRNCHQALQRLDRSIMAEPVNYIVDADIRGFFDTVNFPGFTHYAGISGKENFLLGRKTYRNKMQAKLKELRPWLKSIWNRFCIKSWWPILQSNLTGHPRGYQMLLPRRLKNSILQGWTQAPVLHFA
ncbi:MAG: reverse transcriptase domain-containing protein [Treponema sp.]